MQYLQRKQPDKPLPTHLAQTLLLLAYLLAVILQSTQCASSNPIFLTSLPNIEAGSWVLSTTSSTTSSGFSFENTVVNYINAYATIPSVGFGIDFINSVYPTSLTAQFLIDLSTVQRLQTYAMIQLNRTANSITQLSVNYVVCDSSFWLDVRQNLVDLSNTVAFTSASSISRTVVAEIAYKTKSNSTNAQLTYNTIGIDMYRQNTHIFLFQITLAAKSLSSFNLSILVGGNNRIKTIRICSYSYEAIANSVDPPFYIDLGVVNSFSGNFPDSSGLTISSYGTIYTGMIDWMIDDTNSVLDYNMGGTGLSFSLTTTSISQSKTAFFWYRKQSCPDYTFLNNHVCDSCHYSCLTCFSIAETGCLSCPTTRNYVSTNRTCPCVTNYINVNVTLCVQLTCQPTCLTCANLDQCGTCDTGLGRSLSGINCLCKDYTIDVYETMGQKLCYPCHPTCQTCSAAFSETACLTCNLSKDKRFFRESNSTCACADKFYPPSSTASPVCATCQYSCAKCLIGTTCTECNSTKGRVMNTSNNLCSCLSQYYDDLLYEQCISCPYRCLTCNSQGCLTCDASLFRQISSKQCVCMKGYFDDNANGLCQRCDSSCSTCNSLVECSSCNSSLQRYMEVSTGKQLCLCAPRYYSVVGTEECMFCWTNCVTCNGPSQNNCLSCDGTKFRQLSVDKKCVCKTGYYQLTPTAETCSVCNYTCETCDNTANCLTCSSVNFRFKNGANQCQCETGYYDNGNQLCLKCDYKCLTCSSSATCLTCDATTRNTTTLSNCVCLPGFWDDKISSSCQPCLPECSTCTDGNGCASCPTKKVLTGTKNCVCMPRTYPPNCVDCNYNCQECTNTAIECIKCNGTAMRHLNATSKSCVCYDGYFNDGSIEQCAACHESCLTCTSFASCLACPPNRVKVGALCSCIDKFFENSLNKNCIACHYSCKTCQAFSQCTTCDETKFRNFPLSGPSNLTACTCANGYYDNKITELCYKCDAKCLTCSASSTCLACDSALNRYFVPANNDCICLDAFFEDSTTFLCEACHYSCKTCSSKTSCLTCLIGRQIPFGGGLCLCLSGTFDHPTTKTCTTCSYPCLTCSSSSTTCTSCDSTRNFVPSPVSQCQCKIGTFQNGTACDSCLSTCSECTNKTACTVCKPGTNRNLDGNNLCPCVSGFHDELGTLLTCLKCHYSCVTCSSALSCATCFTGRLPVVSSTCACPSQRFYDDGTNGACIPCAYNCLTCASQPTNCLSCSGQSYRDFTSNQCICKVGYFEDNVEICVKCHHSCKSCSSLSSCSTCDSALQRAYTTGPYCSCTAGYYDDGVNAQCQACDLTCKECTGTSTQCTSCPLTRTHDSVNKKCPCTTGLFDSGFPTCVSCLYSCNQCANANECTSCPTTTRNLEASTKQCLCKDGLYNVNLQKNCLPCDPLCLTCTDFSTCLTCDTSNNLRSLFGGTCVCPNGYYDNWTASANTDPVCQKCHYSCQNCVSLTQCTSCSLLGQRLYNISSKICSCKAGFYDDTKNMPCLKCPSDCLTCSDADTCLTCSAAQRTLNLTSSRCDCATSFYTNGTTCEVCPTECLTCTNLTYCNACKGQRTLSSDNKCICAVGAFMIPNSALCTGCQYSCQSCVSSLMCSTCNATNKRFLSGSFCKCMTGFYDDNTTQPCLSCHKSCKSCVEGSKCLSCDLTANRVLNLATNLCECLTGFYEDPTSELCIKCHQTCVTCLTGTTCATCNNLHYRELNTTNSQCECPVIGYFDDNTQSMCQTCNFKCLSCRTSATTCTSCLTASNRFLQIDKCNCLNGYFDNGALTCAKCSSKCLTCEGVADNCTSCSAAALRTTQPACACQVGFFDDGVNTLCKACDYRCQSCSNAFTCDSCDASKHRTLNPTTKICDCMPVYYDQVNTSNCIPCTFSCVTCAHPTLCLTCPSTRTYKNGICECNIKLYENFLSLECPACDYSCKTCTNATECSSCSVIMSRSFNSTTRKCSCIQGFYDTNLQSELCLKCQKSCFTCTNFTHCLTCPSNVNKTINTTISTLCTCLYGYYEDLNAGIAIGQSSVCYACHYSCEKCSGQPYACTECETAKHRYLNSEKQCGCEQFYFDDGKNELCIKCTTNCLACWGEGPSQCLTCDNSSYILNNQCFTNCPSYYRNFITVSSVKTCKLCTPFCLKCSSSQTICQQCQSTHRLFRYNQTHTLCIDHCPQFYYEEPVTKECFECKAPCYHCSNKYVCTDCLSGYYLDAYCYKCHPYCFSCSGPTVFDCITCVNGYYLDNGLCRKLSCGQFQYVHSLNGCVNCSTTYPNSLTCDSQIIKTCKDKFKLQTTRLTNGLISTVCKTCSDVPGYTMNYLSNGEIQCVEICGDGIVINDQCDDGNKLNGDGCSEFCKVEKDWSCVNKTKCDLKTKPQIKVVKTVKVDKMNRIQVYLELTIGLRLVKQNMILIFSDDKVKFDYNLEKMNSKYTQYKLTVNYQTTVQNVKLAIKVVSPVSQLASLQNKVNSASQTQNQGERMLQELQLAIPLEIELSLQLEIQIATEPPANYINTDTRTVFSYIVYVFLAYQVVCVLLTCWLLYKRIKFMLIVIDLITSMRIIYVLTTFGAHNISELIPTIGKGMQPFIYPFGPAIDDISSVFYSAAYTKLIFSSCCIQIAILLICLGIKYLSDDKNTQNEGHYYLNAFIYCCTFDIYLSCIGILAESEFSSYVGSYSWAFAILILMALMMQNVMYVAEGKSAIYKNRTILPTKSFATGDLDLTKEKQLNNQVLDTSEFHSNHQHNYSDSVEQQVWSQHHTEVVKSQKAESIKEKEPKQKQLTQTKQSLLSLISMSTSLYDLHDLTPSVEYSLSKANTFYGSSSVFYESSSRNKLTLYHLPVLNNIFPLVLVLIATLIKSGNNYMLIRSSLLLGLFFFAFVFIMVQKPETIKSSARNIKLIFNYCIYLSICVILVIATATKSQNANQWIDLSILSIIVLFFVGSITFWVINLKYSPQYKEYLMQIRNQEIIQRNKQAQQPRKKIYTGIDDKSFNNSPIKNIFRKQPEKYIPQSLQSHSVSQANSVNEQRSYYNRNAPPHVENVFEQEQQQHTQQHHYNQRIQFIEPTNDKEPTKQTKVKAISEYDAYLSHYGTFAVVKQPKSSQTIVVKNSKPNETNKKIQQVHEQVRISSNLSDPHSSTINKKTQGNDAIKKSIRLDNQSFIEKNKRVSPRKISTLAKVQRKDDNLNHNSLILDNDLTIVVEEPNRKLSKRIDGNTEQKLLGHLKDQQQKSQISQQHYMYSNPSSQAAVSKSKSKSKGKSSGSLHSNKSLPKKLKTINNPTTHLDQKILMLQQSNNPKNHLAEVSDLVDNQTNQPNESREKAESKVTDYSMFMNKAQLQKQIYESDQSLEVQKQRTGEVRSSFSQQYHEINKQVLKHPNDEISVGLSDDLSDEDYDLEFPTGIKSRMGNDKKRKQVQDESITQTNRPKKLKKSQPQQRGLSSKKQSREKRPSISPSKLSVYQRPHLEDISSIHEEGQEVFSEVSELGIEEDLNVYNKILKDHQKYKDKKVDKKFIEKELRRKHKDDSLDQDDQQ